MQKSIKNGFEKNSTLIVSTLIASILWITNAVFNFTANDYRAFFINILYVICLITLCGAEFKKEKNVIQGMIGALLMISVVGNVNVLSEMLTADIPSRALWQMILGMALTVALFVNHFLISHSGYKNGTLNGMNQVIVIALLAFRCYQIILNVAGSDLSLLVIEVTVGMLAIIPTLNVVVCIECRGDGYKISR